MILLLGVAMISCENTPTKVENPKQETTLELQQMAAIDSTTYKVVEKDNTVYILSTKDNMVVKKISNDSGFVSATAICMLIILLLILLIVITAG